jgi:hypothetical protein
VIELRQHFMTLQMEWLTHVKVSIANDMKSILTIHRVSGLDPRNILQWHTCTDLYMASSHPKTSRRAYPPPFGFDSGPRGWGMLVGNSEEA